MTNPGNLSVYRLRAYSTTILSHYDIISWPATPPSSSSADLKPFLVIPSHTQFRVTFTGYRAGEGGPLPFPTPTPHSTFQRFRTPNGAAKDRH